MNASEWSRILARYREPNAWRSLFEISVTLIPFLAIWALAWWALSVSAWLAMALAAANACFLVRVFMIQHDCGHGAFFRSRRLSDWIGRGLGVLTLTPYDVWRRTHAIHHGTTGNLDRRGVGDIPVLTVQEYRRRTAIRRLLYRLVRNPFVLFGIAPFYTFVLQNRLPVGLMRSGWRYWASAMGTNAAIVAIVAPLYRAGGWEVIVFVFLPTALVGASIGMWLFYVQHQFETTSWDRDGDWDLHGAALNGSSYYALPGVLSWFSANIGVHHVHHLASRIPFYRLGEVLREHKALTEVHRMTLWQSFRCARLHLWDEGDRRLVSFSEARAITD